MREKRRISGLTAGGLTAITAWAGQTTVLSGTTVVSVAATMCRSGSMVFLQHTGYTSAVLSQGYGLNFHAGSVDTGRFMVFAVGSIAPLANVGVNYMIVRRA